MGIIKIVKLKKLKNINGNILSFLKKDDSNFKKFGEVYFSWINSNSDWNINTIFFTFMQMLNSN